MRLARFFGVLVGLAAIAAAALGVSARSAKGTVYVNELEVLTFRTGSASARASAVASALRRQSAKPTVRVKTSRSRSEIRVGSAVITVSRREAAANRSTHASLAGKWASEIRAAIALPALKVGTGLVHMAAGSSRTVAVIGSKAQDSKVRSTSGAVARTSRVPGGVAIKAVGLGTANVVVEAGGATSLIEVRVLPPAASLPQSLSGSVVGLPATSPTVRGAIENAIWNSLRRHPGTQVEFSVPSPPAVPIGATYRSEVPVKVSGAGAIGVEGVVSVSIRNEPIAPLPEAELWYSNDPENVTKPGPLFQGALNADRPARLLYHHLNAAPFGMVQEVHVANDGSVSARLVLMPGDSEPTKNPVEAGIVAGDRFFRNWIHRSGEVVVVPPHSRLILSLRRLAPKETSSGLCYLRLLPGGPDQVTVRVEAKPTFAAEGRWALAMASDGPWRTLGPQALKGTEMQTEGSAQVYPSPFKEVDVAYEVGGKHGFARIGQLPIERADGQGRLFGNFGVLYTIRATLDNPTTAPANLEVVFEASAGYTGALFTVNGEFIRTPLLQPKEELRLIRLTLQPGGRKLYTIQTLPLSGSSYPATLVVRPIDAAEEFAQRLSKRR